MYIRISGPAGQCPELTGESTPPPLELTLPAARGTGDAEGQGPTYDPDSSLRITWTYSTYWQEDNSIEWHNRWDLYFVNQDQSSNIHVLAIINSLVIAFLLSGMVGVVLLRTLNREISTYNTKPNVEDGKRLKRLPTTANRTGSVDEDDEDEEGLLDDITGWKLVHGDVFRPPYLGGLLAPLVGSGVQILVTMSSVLVFALIGVLNPSYRGGFVSFGLFLFVFAGIFSGFFSGRIYKTFGGENWVKNAILVRYRLSPCPDPNTASRQQS